MDTYTIRLSMPGKLKPAVIALPGSKSECNRALIIQALAEGRVQVQNISEAEDTQILMKLLAAVHELRAAGSGAIDGSGVAEPLLLDAGAAGTVMRFMTAFLCVQQGEFILTGSERMKQRPVLVLAEALKVLGAEIRYLEKEGYPPLHIGASNPKNSRVSIQGDISSQYISALLMIAPCLEKGLELSIVGELTSRPYVNMTLQMMHQAGIKFEEQENTISIRHQLYQETEIYVEPDWSASSYWFSIAALAKEADFLLLGLRVSSLQGDRVILKIMEGFGVKASFEEKGLRITKGQAKFTNQLLDLKECPDLAQTLIVCAAALGQNLSFTGLETLRIKETDRIAALQNELAKIGVLLIEEGVNFRLDTSGLNFPNEVSFATYHDHRMAMAFAPLALRIKNIYFDDQKVVVKSYPAFWEHLKLSGFQTETYGR